MLAVQGAFDIAAHAPANDEIAHIPAGYDAVAHRGFWLSPEQPPLVKAWAALPLLLLRPRWPTQVEQRESRMLVWEVGHAFFYHSGNDPHLLVMLPRIMCLVLAVVLGLVVLAWGVMGAGLLTGIAALAFLAFDPNLLAASTIVYTDLGATLGALLVLLAARSILRGVTPRRALALGSACGVAFAAKFSTLVLLPLVVVALAWGAWRGEGGGRDRRRRGLGRIARHGALAALAAAVVLWAAYSFTWGPVVRGTSAHRMLSSLFPGDPSRVNRAAAALAGISLPAPDLWRGLALVLVHNREGHRAFLRGEFSQSGFTGYFPIAFAVKTPLPTLCLIVLGLASFAWRRPRADDVLLGAAVLLLFGSAVASHINIGYRHILPVVPPLVLFGARSLAAGDRRRAPRWIGPVLVALVVWQAIDAASVGAHHHAFFNALGGGPANGHRILLDSNLDLGQDLPLLSAYQKEHGIGEVALAYAGEAESSAYGVRWRPFTQAELYDAGPGVYVVSVNELFNLATPDDPARFAWLRARRPDAVLGYTLYVYSVPAAAESTTALSASLPGNLQGHRRPLAQPAFHEDFPTMDLKNAVAEREPHPDPHSRSLGCEARVEDPLYVSTGNPATAVADADDDVGPFHRGLDPDRSRARDRLGGISKHAHESLVEQARVAGDLGDLFAVLAHDLHSVP